MFRRTVSAILLTLLLTSMLTLAFNIQPVKAEGTIYIRADGSIDPPTAPISTVDNFTYTFIDNIYDSIVIERSNIIIDGNGFVVQGPQTYLSVGIYLSGRENVTIRNTQIKDFYHGILLNPSSNYNRISGNNITASNITANNYFGIVLGISSNNIISGNNIANTYYGIDVEGSSYYNSISGNNITTNLGAGIWIRGASDYNSISGNNIANNSIYGIVVDDSSNYNSISGNSIVNNYYGVYVGLYSAYNSISGNSIVNNYYGIDVTGSSYYNSISGNNITANLGVGIWLLTSSNNCIYHNNFIENTRQVYDYSWDHPGITPSINTWDDGYPSGGNYWSDYTDEDLNNDGIWDHPYVIDENNQDRYPLVNPWSSASPWPMFRHDVQHTGRSRHVGPETPAVRWTLLTGGDICSSPAVGADGTIYVGSWDHKLYAVSPDGSLRWNLAVDNMISSSPAIGLDGTIFVGALEWGGGNMYAINADGTLKWAFNVGGRIASSPAIGADGTIYVGSEDIHRLYAIEPNGTLKWSFTTGNDVGSSPAIGVDGTVYVGSMDHNLYAINPDGTLKWSFTAGDRIGSSPAIGVDGTVYVGSYDCNLYAINPDGLLKWSFTTYGVITSSPALGADGSIYVGSADGKLYAVNPDGSLRWSFTTGAYVSSSPAIDADGSIYVGSADGKLYAVNSDGSLKWSFATADWIRSSPAIGSDGTIYVGSDDNKLYALGLGPAPPTPDFSIAASPESLSIQQGSSGTSTITTSSRNDFNQPVQLTVSGAPSGVTPTLNPQQVTPPAGGSTTSTLTVSVATSATLGSHTLIVTGTSGILATSKNIPLEITTSAPSGPPQPCNILPADGATDVSRIPTFRVSPPFQDIERDLIPWEDPEDTLFTDIYYQWQITLISADYSDPVYDFTQHGVIQPFSLPDPVSGWWEHDTDTGDLAFLDYETTHYWRVRYKDFRGVWSPWSEETAFTTKNDPAPEHLIDALKDLRKTLLRKIDYDIDNTAMLFAEVRDYRRAKQWADIFGPFLEAFEKGLEIPQDLMELVQNPIGAFRNAKNFIHGISIGVMFAGLSKKVGGFCTALFGPSYATAIKNMLRSADDPFLRMGPFELTFDKNLYRNIIETYLISPPSNELSPLLIPRRSGTEYRDIVDYSNGFLGIKVSINRVFNRLIEDVSTGNFPNKLAIHNLISKVNELKTKILQSSNTNNIDTEYDTYLLTDGQLVPEHVRMKLGTPEGLLRFFSDVAGSVSESLTMEIELQWLGLEKSVVTVLKYVAPGLGKVIEIPQTIIDTYSLGLEVASLVKYWNTEELFYMLPEQMLLSLPSEFSNIWAIADDLDRSTRNQLMLYPSVPENQIPLVSAHLCSPGELRVLDSEGRMTGLENGQVREEIPGSYYYENTVTVFYPSELDRYEVVGKTEGVYGLTISSVEAGDNSTFVAIGIPTGPEVVQKYEIDWNALSLGGKGVTVQVDSDGDLKFEHNFTSDRELTRTEYLIEVRMPGDLNMDRKVDLKDIALAARAFGETRTRPRWNPMADINQDGKIDLRDIALVARNFGKTYS